ncbi:MAG: TIGR03663 family protein, partial [Dehalococcoidia bacterium]|nr:TIGR03663 family protein [Dehalococcoidia bacterium]
MTQLVDRPSAVPVPSTSPLDRVLGVVGVTWEVAAYLALLAVGGVMRLWDLGVRAMHHDESLHVLYGWYLYVGRGYQNDPMMHGPFHYHAIALSY